MSSPTPPQEPQGGWQQPPAGGQPPAYGQPPSGGQQPPAYGQPPTYGQPPAYGNAPAAPAGFSSGARPPQVTTAVVLGFVAAAFLLLGGFGLFALATFSGVFALLGVLYLVLGAGTIYGGVQALQGKGSTVLSYAGLAIAGLSLVGIVLALTRGSFQVTSLISVVIGAGIFFLLRQPPAQQWFASRGTR